MEIKVKGLKELQQQLINLGSITGTKAMRGAMRAATKPMLLRIKTTVPVSSGALQAAERQVFFVSNFFSPLRWFGGGASGDGSTFTIKIGAKVRDRTAIALYNLVHKRKRPRRGIYHGHYVEFGTKSGTPRRDFMRNAAESTAERCVVLLASELGKRIDRALKSKRPVNA